MSGSPLPAVLSSQARPVAEVLVAYFAITVVAIATLGLERVPFLSGYAALPLAVAFVVIPLRSARMRGGARAMGIALGGWFEPPDTGAHANEPLLKFLVRSIREASVELGIALALAVMTFPPFAYGFALWVKFVNFAFAGVMTHGSVHFDLALPPDMSTFALNQVLIVALPEEVFFRGFVFTRLTEALETRGMSARRRMHVVNLIQALLFALVHFAVDPNPGRLAVLFPGLVFGYLRAWRGGVGAAIWYHALCNACGEVLARSISIS